MAMTNSSPHAGAGAGPSSMRPPVSVVIPVFNRPESLMRAIRSACAELGPDDELIVVDDDSSPPIVLDSAMQADRRIRLVRKPVNGGPASARNAGVAAATRDLIAFLDSDDEWLPGKLAAQTAVLAGAGDGLVAVACGWRETVDGREFRQRTPVPSRSRSDFFAGCWFCPGTTLLLPRRNFLEIGPLREDIRRLEDMEWFMRFGQAGGRLLVADIIGATIARGGNARPDLVEQAAGTIMRDLAKAASDTERRDLAAYLDLERAGAFRNVGDRVRSAFHLARSLLRRPRLRPALHRWWR